MPDELLQRLRRFHEHTFPGVQEQFQNLVKDGQHPTILFIGCSDSRLVPNLLTGTGPGELFVIRNVGAFVPPYDGSAGYHGTSAAIEFAVRVLRVKEVVVRVPGYAEDIRMSAFTCISLKLSHTPTPEALTNALKRSFLDGTERRFTDHKYRPAGEFRRPEDD